MVASLSRGSILLILLSSGDGDVLYQGVLVVASLSRGSILSILLSSSNGDVHLPPSASLLTS